MSDLETHVAILTPAGRGAVATVAIRGPQASAIAQPHFAAASGTPITTASDRILFGKFHGIGGAEEEIVAVVTGKQAIDLHCHGGPAAADAIVKALVAGGAKEVAWQLWASSDGEDPIQVECRVALSAAKTTRTCAILLDQYRGALASELARIDALLASKYDVQQREAHKRLARLMALWRTVGPHLTAPWRIVIAGEPNVGKSSLINAILGYERSIVFDQPGTTRDALSAITAIDGWPAELVDTAGLRSAADPLEAAGMERTRDQLASADCVLHVTDVTLASQLATPADAILVGNKADLITPHQRQAWLQGNQDSVLVSAKTGDGIAELCHVISLRLAPSVPEPGEAVPFTARQFALVQSRL